MKTSIIIPIVILALLSACNNNGNSHDNNFENLTAIASDSASSYFVLENGSPTIENNYFLSHQFEDSSGLIQEYVIAVKERAIRNTEGKGVFKTYELQPKYSSKAIKDWKLSPHANYFAFKKNVIEFEKVASEEFESMFHLYNLDSGDWLMSNTYGRLEATFPDGIQKRFFGFYSLKAPDAFFAKTGSGIPLGYFTYASDQSQISVFALIAKNNLALDSLDKSTPVMEFVADALSDHLSINSGRGLYLSGEPADGKSLNFSIKNTFFFGANYKELDVIIPIKNDKIDFDNIEYDSKYFTIEKIEL